MYYRSNNININAVLRGMPDAVATVRGNSEYQGIHGSVKFYQTARGVLTVAEIFGLPVSAEKCGNDIFAFHIHSGACCTGNEEDEFADAGTHYNPTECPHPYHSGDMPLSFPQAAWRSSHFSRADSRLTRSSARTSLFTISPTISPLSPRVTRERGSLVER